MYGAGAGWIPRLLAGGKIRVTEIHQERNPFFGGINPEPIRPWVDEALGIIKGGGYDMGLLLDGDADRAGAADEQGTFIHQLQVTGLLMYYLAEYRGLRQPVVVSVNNTSMAGRLGERYGIPTYETSVGFKYIGPKMIETGAMMGAEESGGYGFGMHLPERDGVYADLLLLDLFLREKAAGRWPVSKAIAHFHEIAGPSWYRRIDVHIAARRVRRGQAPAARRPRRERADRARRPAGVADPVARHQGRVQVLRRRRLVAARPDVRHRAARPGLHRGDVRGGAGADAGGRRAAGSRLVSSLSTERARTVPKPWGHELIWALTDRYCGKIIVIETGRRLSLQRHEQKDESIYVLSGRLLLYLEDDGGTVATMELGQGDGAHVPVGRIHRYEAIERVELIEVSTPELDDVIRLEDDFGREGTNAP